MIKYRKIRGHNRIQTAIESWKNYNLELDLEYLEEVKRNYCKIWVSPFANISVIGSEIPSPKGKNRALILEGLLAIFNNWEKQIKTLNKPYYLAIWLYEPRMEKSQVVCAIDEMLGFYDNTFFKPKEERKLPTQNYGKFEMQLNKLDWKYALDEDTFFQSDIDLEQEMYSTEEDYIDTQKWYRRKIKEGARQDSLEQDTLYAVRKGTVWIGTKN